MIPNIMNDEAWEKLKGGVSLIPENWSSRCVESIRHEKAEIEKRHNIKIGQTTILCARCGKSLTTPNGHKGGLYCRAGGKTDEVDNDLIAKIRAVGIREAARRLKLSYSTISYWILKGNVPKRRQKEVAEF